MMGLLMLGPSLMNAEDSPCECGSHATGIYTYHVGDGEDCCSGSPGDVGFFYTYRQSEGVWMLVDKTIFSGTEVQDHCCTLG